jgi:hypothetical protein
VGYTPSRENWVNYHGASVFTPHTSAALGGSKVGAAALNCMTMASVQGEPLQRKLTMDQKLKLAAAQRDAQLAYAKSKPQTNTAAATAAAADTSAAITGGIGGALGGIKEGLGGALEGAKATATGGITEGLGGALEGAKATAGLVKEPPNAQGNGVAEGTEPTSPKTPKSPGIGGTIMGGIGGGADLIKGGIGGGVDLAKKGVDGAKDGAKRVGDVGKGALEATLKTLGGKAAFQQVFASTIDKSDAGLEKAFKQVDTDASGQISAAEMSAHIASVYGSGLDESITAEMLKAADTDGDGEVSLDEFKTIMRAGPDVKPKAAATKPDNSQWAEPGAF